ncbi:hypothetical protein BC828DRAFT_388623 [Blastocladiella britannica]|nr:hypothetical protein BC828DRAFT_388623 [Blastocladiella britannica]
MSTAARSDALVSFILFAASFPMCLASLWISFQDRRQRRRQKQPRRYGHRHDDMAALDLSQSMYYWLYATVVHAIDMVAVWMQYNDTGWFDKPPLYGSDYYNVACPVDIAAVVSRALELFAIPYFAGRLILELTPLAFAQLGPTRQVRVMRPARALIGVSAVATAVEFVVLVAEHAPSFGTSVDAPVVQMAIAADAPVYAVWITCMTVLGIGCVTIGFLARQMLHRLVARRVTATTAGAVASPASPSAPGTSLPTNMGESSRSEHGAVRSALARVGSRLNSSIGTPNPTTAAVRSVAKPQRLLRQLELVVASIFALILVTLAMRMCQGTVGIQLSWGITIVFARIMSAILYVFVRLTRLIMIQVRSIPTGDAGTLAATWAEKRVGDDEEEPPQQVRETASVESMVIEGG